MLILIEIARHDRRARAMMVMVMVSGHSVIINLMIGIVLAMETSGYHTGLHSAMVLDLLCSNHNLSDRAPTKVMIVPQLVKVLDQTARRRDSLHIVLEIKAPDQRVGLPSEGGPPMEEEIRFRLYSSHPTIPTWRNQLTRI